MRHIIDTVTMEVRGIARLDDNRYILGYAEVLDRYPGGEVTTTPWFLVAPADKKYKIGDEVRVHIFSDVACTIGTTVYHEAIVAED